MLSSVLISFSCLSGQSAAAFRQQFGRYRHGLAAELCREIVSFITEKFIRIR